MTLPSSGQLSINDIAGEFGGSTPHALSEYYRGGPLVPDSATNSGIPASGQIAIGDFYGGDALAVSGGNIANGLAPGNGYVYHTFSSPGTLSISGGSKTVEYLVVAGGAPGFGNWTGDAGGAGGAGGVRNGNLPISSPVSVTVGGASQNSAFGPVSCTRGGQGGQRNGQPGGSGGGGTGWDAARGGGSGVSGEGNSGGTGAHQGPGGGGGGKGGGGGTNGGGAGGQYPGFQGPLIGLPGLNPYSGYFGGGGGGHGRWGPPGSGGSGGGGGAPNGHNPGIDYLGAGGCGGNNNYYSAGGGGQGLVVIRYTV